MLWPGWLLLTTTRTRVGGWKWTDLPPAWVLVLVALVLFVLFRALYRRERGRVCHHTGS